MSRSGYTEDCENLELYRHSVERALKGKRGQKFLREMADALDAMPVKELIPNALQSSTGEVCALGAICVKRGIKIREMFADPAVLAEVLGIARSMAAEIMWVNDEADYSYNNQFPPLSEAPADRWKRIRGWVGEWISTA